MNANNSTVDKTYNDRRRVKRIKTEEAKGRDKGVPELSGVDQSPQDGRADRSTTDAIETMETDSDHMITRNPMNGDTIRAHVMETSMLEPNLSSTQRKSQPSTFATNHLPELVESKAEANSTSTAPDIDFSSAPADPIELAWWVAQQITHFHSDSPDSAKVESPGHPRQLSSQPPGKDSRQTDVNLDLRQTEERERLRSDNRERKKRWRESNVERSMCKLLLSYVMIFGPDSRPHADRDNDLRCRINRRAKIKFGAANNAEKTAWIKEEYNKRRNKREIKQRARVIESGEFPSFALAPELGDCIFSSQNPDLPNDVQIAGNLLLNALFGVGNNGSECATADAAHAFKATVDSGSLNPQPFVEALKIMARNVELMKGISARLEYDGDDLEHDTMSGDENGSPPPHANEAHAESTSSPDSSLNQQSNQIIKALNAATALLYQMADTKAYASPYGNPPPQVAPVMNGHNHKTNGTDPPSASTQTGNGHGLDQSQIDALLALANGGSLTDDEDDKTIVDTDEMNGQQLESSGLPQTDTDITATLQRIINQLTAEKKVGQSSSNGIGLPMPRPVTPYGSQSVQDQAATLQSLFTQVGVSINTVMPAAQSHATSALYNHLSNQAKSSIPSGGINPAHASAYGNTAQMQQRMLAKAGIFGETNQSQHQPSPGPGTPPGTHVGLPTRIRDPEELRKIEIYGYPPLPGSWPGAKKK